MLHSPLRVNAGGCVIAPKSPRSPSTTLQCFYLKARGRHGAHVLAVLEYDAVFYLPVAWLQIVDHLLWELNLFLPVLITVFKAPTEIQWTSKQFRNVCDPVINSQSQNGSPTYILKKEKKMAWEKREKWMKTRVMREKDVLLSEIILCEFSFSLALYM